jgi:hypothetical protein
MKKPKLIPPDRNRCQANHLEGCWPDAEHFMIIGPRELVRCTNKPTVIVAETKPGQDGLIGSMSLCNECLARLVELKGADYFTSEPIKH